MIKPGDKIKSLRQQLGINMTELAELAGIGQSTLSYIESSERSPSLEVLEKICKALGVTLSEFFAENSAEEELPPHLKKLLLTVKNLPVEFVNKVIEFAQLYYSIRDIEELTKQFQKHEVND